MMSLFKNKWLAMMLLCGSMDLTYVDAMRRHPERKVDDVASAIPVCTSSVRSRQYIDLGLGLAADDYKTSQTVEESGDTNLDWIRSIAAPIIHPYHPYLANVFPVKFTKKEGIYFNSLARMLTTDYNIDCSDVQCAFFVVQSRSELMLEDAPLLFRPHPMFAHQYTLGGDLFGAAVVEAIMLSNDTVVRLQKAEEREVQIHMQNGSVASSPNRFGLKTEDGTDIMFLGDTRVVIYKMIFNGMPIMSLNILSDVKDSKIWEKNLNKAREESLSFGDMMRRLIDEGWLSSSPSLFEPGAPLAAFLPQPTMVAVLPEPEQPVVPQPPRVVALPEQGQPVVPSSDAKVPPKKNLHLRLCLPPEPEQPVVPQPTMVEVLPEQEQPVVPSSDVGVRLCQRRVLENDTSYTLSDCDTVRLPIRIRQMVTGSEGMQDVNLILSASISDPEFVGAVCSSFAWDLQTDTDKQVDFFIATRDWNLSSICLVNEEDRLSHMWILKKGLRDEVSCEGSIGKLDIRSDGEFNSDSSCVVCYKQLMGQDGSINCGVVLLLDPSDADKYMQVLRTAEAPTIGASLTDCWSRNALHDVAGLRVLSAFFKW